LHFLRRAISLSPADWRLRFEAIAVLALVRLGLWILPFKTVGRLTAGTTAWLGSNPAGTAQRVSRAIPSSARLVPGASCLTQALAAEVLMRRRGHPCSLRLGVARNAAGDLRAHAWLESNGVSVVGGGLSDYTLLPAFESLRR